jgi:hypothetical protein
VNQEERVFELEERSSVQTGQKRSVKAAPWGRHTPPIGKMRKRGLLRARYVDKVVLGSADSSGFIVSGVAGSYVSVGTRYYVTTHHVAQAKLRGISSRLTFNPDDVWLSHSEKLGDTLQSIADPRYEPSELHSASEARSSETELLTGSQVPNVGEEEKDSIGKLRSENKQLSLKVEVLQAELRKNVPYLQLYRFGAGAFSLSVISLVAWLLTGVAIPFHPVFALTALPSGVAFMIMAWMIRKDARHVEHDS